MRYYKLLLLPVILLFAKCVLAQQGCTDFQATNFDPAATVNDGGCIYPVTTLPLLFKCNIKSPLLAETSGILNLDNNYWTHVDNTDNSIYRIDTASNTVFQQVEIQNAGNQDWEDIASDEDHIYIGDFGNNGGGRTNLRFYKISKSDIDSASTSVNAGKIRFTYSDQVVFNLNHGNYYDCEAFIVMNDTIHMFTKGWSNKWTKHYILPADTGVQVAQLVDSFDVDGLVTSAAMQGDSVLILLGLNYSGAYESFIWAFSKFNGSDFFSGNKRKFVIGDINTVGQVEAICFSAPYKGFITNEKLSATPSQLREFDLNPYLNPKPNPVVSVSFDTTNLSLKACPDTGTISITIRNSTITGGENLNFTVDNLPVFASVTPLFDTVSVGDSTTITISLRSGTLPGGTYLENFDILTNDPFNPILQIPLMLNIDSRPCVEYSFESDTCTGITYFTMPSRNSATSSYWDFGDGHTSSDVNPTHSFAMSGTYAVSLIGCNNSGCDTVIHNVTVTINGPKATACYPQTQADCCGSGITHFGLSGSGVEIINSISDASNTGFEDFSCTIAGTMITNFPYTLSCTTAGTNNEFLKVWLDLNNDGILDPATEEIFSSIDTSSNLHSGILTISSNPGNVYGVPLRMRVAADYQSNPEPCLDPLFGQHEDYSIILNLPTEVNEIANETGLRIYPNPFAYSTTFDYTLKNSCLVILEIYNVVGERVETLVNSEMQTSGNYLYELTGQIPGIYFAKLSVNGKSLVERIVKL